MTASNRIVSLWDMIEIGVAELVEYVRIFSAWSDRLDLQSKALSVSHTTFPINETFLDHSDIAIPKLRRISQSAGLRLNGPLDRLEFAVSGARADNSGASQFQLEQFERALSGLINALIDALRDTKVFALDPDHARFYEPDEPLFGEEVENAFPSSSPEIAEVGKCRAVGRWTACVMHLMRALEPGLMALQAAVEVNAPKEQWDQVLNQIEAKIKEIRKATHGKVDEQWYSEAASHFRFIKDAWRNYAQHLHERYDEERAVVIYDNVRAFMRHLATRLKE